ncbi:MAG: hypothetical protein K2Q18_05165 [Bdellovibrionales bacterium]|nr:hypothetical protein [Bdellovibrionales bacterium]
MALTSTYAVHFPMIGKSISSDFYNHLLAIIFTPWVSQIYLTMAAFNLARKNQSDFSEGLTNKLKIFGLILIYFVFENFLVAPNFGQAISFYPIMLWMIILGSISFVYKFLGIRGVIVFTLLAMLRFIVPVEYLSDFFEEVVQNSIHPGFEYDARIEYFILSGCLGFLMGHVHYHKNSYKNRKDFLFMGMGILFVLIYVLIGDPFTVPYDDVFRTEHDLARTFSGTAYIIGVQAILISFFLWLESKNIKIRIPLINWIGIYSLLIFALHRIFFVKLIMPVSIAFGSLTGRTVGAGIIEVYIYIFIALGLCYFVKVSPISDIVLQKRR